MSAGRQHVRFLPLNSCIALKYSWQWGNVLGLLQPPWEVLLGGRLQEEAAAGEGLPCLVLEEEAVAVVEEEEEGEEDQASCGRFLFYSSVLRD